MSYKLYRFDLINKHGNTRFDERNCWEISAKNKTEARKKAREEWVKVNGYHFTYAFSDYKIVWKEEES